MLRRRVSVRAKRGQAQRQPETVGEGKRSASPSTDDEGYVSDIIGLYSI